VLVSAYTTARVGLRKHSIIYGLIFVHEGRVSLVTMVMKVLPVAYGDSFKKRSTM